MFFLLRVFELLFVWLLWSFTGPFFASQKGFGAQGLYFTGYAVHDCIIYKHLRSTCAYIYIYVCIHGYIYIHTLIFICVVDLCVSVHIHIYTYIHRTFEKRSTAGAMPL